MDELSVYRGKDIKISKSISVIQPTLDQIERFGERIHFNAVYSITATGADYKWQLYDYHGVDYTTISDYDLFVKYTYKTLGSKKSLYNEIMQNKDKYQEQLKTLDEDDLNDMLVNPLSLILKDIDLDDFIPYVMKNKEDEIILYDYKHDITIDRVVFTEIVNTIRSIYGLKRNGEIPGNESTKQILIDDARDEAIANSRKPYKSVLKPLISSVAVHCGMCGDERIWNMPIGQLFDNIKRINKIQDATLLLQGAYSGFSSLKGVDKERLNWSGDI